MRRERYVRKDVNFVNVAHVKKMFTDPDQYGGQFADYIKQRRVMQWGDVEDASFHHRDKHTVVHRTHKACVRHGCISVVYRVPLP